MIERNLGNELSLSDIADGCGVSKFHMARAFEARVGMPVMQYVRARRLSNAAERLAEGAADILSLALDTGYASHEAFSRAFKAQFDLTPEVVRKHGTSRELNMMKPASVPNTASAKEAIEPRIEKLGALTVVGLSCRQNLANAQAIPGQWQQFMTRYEEIDNKAEPIPVSVTTDMDGEGNFSYLTGVLVSSAGSPPKGLVTQRVPAQTYAVFTHSTHVSEIPKTYAAIWDQWVPQSGKVVSDGPWLEKHMPTFNPRTGLGGIEIWIPVT
ncbi:MAG: AraC family transcriptional regulator [Bradyrhizobium sp.]